MDEWSWSVREYRLLSDSRVQVSDLILARLQKQQAIRTIRRHVIVVSTAQVHFVTATAKECAEDGRARDGDGHGRVALGYAV